MSNPRKHPTQVAFTRALGLSIRSARKASLLSQNNVAKLLGVSQQCVAAWEGGRHAPTLSTLVRLSQVLKVPISGLFAGAEGYIESEARFHDLPGGGLADAIEERMKG